MTHDIFISYSKADKVTADAVCHGIEQAGIRCWIAPRDVPAGRSWKRSIVRAIREAQAMILIFSGKANSSPQVQREVDIAFEAGNPILPFRIEEIEMNEDLYYCVGSRHWLDGLTPPLEQHIERLVDAVSVLISSSAVASSEEPTAEKKFLTPESPSTQSEDCDDVEASPIEDNEDALDEEPNGNGPHDDVKPIKDESPNQNQQQIRAKDWKTVGFFGVTVVGAIVATVLAIWFLLPKTGDQTITLNMESGQCIDVHPTGDQLPFPVSLKNYLRIQVISEDSIKVLKSHPRKEFVPTSTLHYSNLTDIVYKHLINRVNSRRKYVHVISLRHWLDVERVQRPSDGVWMASTEDGRLISFEEYISSIPIEPDAPGVDTIAHDVWMGYLRAWDEAAVELGYKDYKAYVNSLGPDEVSRIHERDYRARKPCFYINYQPPPSIEI